MVRQVARDVLGGSRQKAAPLDLEVSHGRLVTLPGIVAGAGMEVTINFIHGADSAGIAVFFAKMPFDAKAGQIEGCTAERANFSLFCV
jgi:hypothetical protein